MRIVAGTAKGRKIEAPKGMDVRPTTDRVREALFSSLAFRIVDNRVLDLFAGTGALGLEALSRGAASAVLVDRAKSSADLVRRNIALCGFQNRASVLIRDAVAAVQHLGAEEKQFDLIFLDPPYRGPLLESALAALADASLLAPGGLILAEHPSGHPPEMPDGFSITRTRRYGKTVLSFVQRTLDLERSEQE